jgi:minichromosome maintenance protein 10
MALPTFGARNLQKHLARAKASGRVSVCDHGVCAHVPQIFSTTPQCVACVLGSSKPAIQSISASALLKQQKQQMLEMRKRRSEDIQKR